MDRLAFEKDVFGNGKLGNEIELLMDDGDARVHGLTGRAKLPRIMRVVIRGYASSDAPSSFLNSQTTIARLRRSQKIANIAR